MAYGKRRPMRRSQSRKIFRRSARPNTAMLPHSMRGGTRLV